MEANADAVAEQAAQLERGQAALAAREAAVKARELAVTNVEQQLAANQITEGMWVVGVDVAPGRYRAVNVPADCHWAILKSDTNGREIIENDLPGGGNPQVRIAEGQDFSTIRCGTWTKVR